MIVPLFFLSPVFQAAGYELEPLIIRPALELVGSSYASGAAGPDRFDCSGFVNYLYKPYLQALPRTSRDMAGTGKPVDRSELMPGDLVFFATGSSPGSVTHVAIYIGQDSLVHAVSNGPERGVIITGLSTRYWDRRYHSSRRVLPDSFYAAAGSNRGEALPGEAEETGAAAQYQEKDSPWDSFNGIVEGDYGLWRQNEEKSFEAWKKENQPGG